MRREQSDGSRLDVDVRLFGLRDIELLPLLACKLSYVLGVMWALYLGMDAGFRFG
jgi:hypothetical protein